MGSIGALLALITCFVCDGRAVAQQGFFQGWNWFVFSVAAQVGLGGLLTALVVKYADNILKGPLRLANIFVTTLIVASRHHIVYRELY